MEKKFNDECERAKNYVKTNEQDLRAEYGNDYIAVHPDGRVVDSDRNELLLSQRVGKEFPERFVLISTINEIVNNEETSLDSPEGFV